MRYDLSALARLLGPLWATWRLVVVQRAADGVRHGARGVTRAASPGVTLARWARWADSEPVPVAGARRPASIRAGQPLLLLLLLLRPRPYLSAALGVALPPRLEPLARAMFRLPQRARPSIALRREASTALPAPLASRAPGAAIVLAGLLPPRRPASLPSFHPPLRHSFVDPPPLSSQQCLLSRAAVLLKGRCFRG